ncbi:hypothetical protein R1sor_003940 [Riccia sorocarpa]|uniref:Uncharacterized protein n=1 Tax=Riccia sorocarpa TaxID=122646 RepID=A0ABD3H3F4_9MARC
MNMRYQLDVPLSAGSTLGELQALNKSSKSFSISKVSEHISKAGIIPIDWTETQVDWYLPRIEFDRVRKLLKGSETIDGPFKFLEANAGFFLLEDCNGERFHHPKFFRKTENGRKVLPSMTMWIWTFRCLCEYKEGTEDIPVTCFCFEIFPLPFCLRMKAEARARKEKQVTENAPKSPQQRQPKMKTTQTTAGESSVQAAAPVREAAKRKRSPATTPPKPRKVRRVSEKDMDISLTVGVPGEDITGVTFDRLALYMEENVRMGIIAMERGGLPPRAAYTRYAQYDGEDIGDIVELEKVELPGDDVEKLSSDLLYAGYNVASNPTTPKEKKQSVEEIPPIDLKHLEVDTADIELLLSNLLFTGNELENKRKTTAVGTVDVDALPAYIPLCRSSAAGDLHIQ